MKKSHAWVLAGIAPIIVYGLVLTVLTDKIFADTRVPRGRELRAAVAIRDNVTPFQKWGTKMFTWCYLRRYYDDSWYFTQAGKEDKQQEFLARLDNALERYPQVDLYLLSHKNKYVQWMAKLPPEHLRHLRLVYNTGCENLGQGPEWLKFGAKTYVAHPGESASPVFYYFFLRRWSRGHAIGAAMDESNAHMREVFRRFQAATLGYANAEQLYSESRASSYGDTNLRIGE